MAVKPVTSMIEMRPIGIVHSPYSDTSQVPKGRGAKHDADGTPILDIKPYLSSVPESALRRGWFDQE